MRACFAAALVCIAGSVSAQDWSAAGNAPAGALACSGCHGTGSDIPLSGLSADEIETAMLQFRDGTRDATVMNRLAAGFDESEIALIAEWIAKHGGGE